MCRVAGRYWSPRAGSLASVNDPSPPSRRLPAPYRYWRQPAIRSPSRRRIPVSVVRRYCDSTPRAPRTLESWVSIRSATTLVHERSGVECSRGQAGSFSAGLPPRGRPVRVACRRGDIVLAEGGNRTRGPERYPVGTIPWRPSRLHGIPSKLPYCEGFDGDRDDRQCRVYSARPGDGRRNERRQPMT